MNWNTMGHANLRQSVSSTRVTLSDSSQVRTCFSGDSGNMFVWFCRDMRNTFGYDTVSTGGSYNNGSYYSSHSINNITVNFNGFPADTLIKLKWYDTWTGNQVGSDVSFSSGSVSTTIPSFYRDIVAILKPEE